ncbi:hypothetical protein O8C80_00025 [Aliarcobacter butzleri]|uniref:hypothetical protein n=1 Tax=Aliarcobacter butzleri TaxID=28197 RepID=UPI00263C3CD1|nr:hypothetical protein [Aliarcobacter butzleri]MDN5041704.1 hypothetical protein [Aliarcobacter butzleri]
MFNGKNPEDLKNSSPHSGYVCVIGCGDSKTNTENIKQYFDSTTNKFLYLNDFYRSINTEPSYSNVYHTENITKEEKK